MAFNKEKKSNSSVARNKAVVAILAMALSMTVLPLAEAGHGSVGVSNLTPGTVGVAGTLTQDVTITNPGPVAMDQIRFTAPATGTSIQWSLTSSSAGGWTPTLSGANSQVVTFAGSAMPATTTQVFTLVFSIPGGADGTTVPVTVDVPLAGSSPIDNIHVADPTQYNVIQKLPDNTKPVVVDARTVDADKDGQIDGLRIQFSENIDDATITQANWAVAAPFTKVTVVTGDGANGYLPHGVNDAYIFIKVEERNDGASPPKPIYNTGAIIDFTYTAGTLADLAVPANTLNSINSAGVVERDGAGPTLIKADGDIGSNRVKLTFSEGVKGTGTGGKLRVADLVYTDNTAGGAGAISSVVSHTAGSATAVVALNGNLQAADLTPTPDQIQGSASVVDNVSPSNSGSATKTNLVDQTGPTIQAVATRDLDGDGLIDALHVTFNEPVKDSSYDPADWTIAAPYGTATGKVGTTGVGANPVDDDVLVITFNQNPGATIGTDFDTDKAPALTYNAGGGTTSILTDTFNNAYQSAAQIPPTTDGAGPVIKSIVTVDSSQDGLLDGILVGFSEKILDSTLDKLAWEFDGASPYGVSDGGHGNHPKGIQSGTANDEFILLFFDQVAGSGDTGVAPEIGYLRGASHPTALLLKDLNGNELATQPISDVARGALPVIKSVASAVGSTQVTVTFSEGVDNGGGVGLAKEAFVFQNNNGAGATTVSAVAHSAGATTATLTLDVALTSSDFSSDALGLAAGLVVATVDDRTASPNVFRAFSDTVRPVITKVETQDTDLDGLLDGLKVTFSEPINEGVVLETNEWQIQGGTYGTGVNKNPTSIDKGSPEDGVIVLRFAEVVPALPARGDTAAIPNVAFVPGVSSSIVDHAGNELNGGTVPATIDRAGPVVVRVATVDANANGLLDALRVTLSESVTDATINNPLAWTLAAPYGDSNNHPVFSTGATANDAIIDLQFTERTGVAGDTGQVPTLIHDAGVQQPTDNAAVANNLAGAIAPTIDAALPVLVTASVNVGSSSVAVTFSEGVTGTGTGNKVGLPDLSYADVSGNGASSLTQTNHVAGDATLTASLDVVAVFDDVDAAGTPDTLGAVNLKIQDAAGNKAATTARALSDAAKPTITSIKTVDANSNGQIDALRVTFNEPILDSSFSVGDWSVDGGYGAVLANADANINDAVLLLSFNEKSVPDTGAKPSLAFSSSGTITDRSGNAMDPTVGLVATTDGAKPRFVSATTQDADRDGKLDQIEVKLSEAIKDGFFVPSHWQLQAPYGTGANNNPTSVTTGATGDDDTILLKFPEQASRDTAAVPTVAYVAPANSVKDAAANEMAAFAAVASKDGTPPVVTEARTLDLSTDGQIDAYRVTFSENLNQLTIDPNDFAIGGQPAVAVTINGPTQFTLGFVPSGIPDTGDKPQLTYSGSLRDSADVLVPAFGNDHIVEIDTAEPRLVKAQAIEGSSTLELIFSEKVRHVGGGAVLAADITYTDNNPVAPARTGTFSHTVNTAQATMTMSKAFAGIDFGDDTIVLDINKVEDLATTPNVAPGVTLALLDKHAADTTPPTIVGAISGISKSPAWTKSTTGSLTWLAANDNAGGSGIKGYTTLLDGAGNPASTSSDPSFQTGRTFALTALTQGDHSFKVRALDFNDNAGPVTTFDFRVDSVAPTAGVLSSSSHAEDQCTSADDVVLSWTPGTDSPGSGIPTADAYTVQIGGDAAIKKASNELSHTFQDVNDGEHTVTLTTFDVAGNTATDTYKVKVGVSAPTGTVETPAYANAAYPVSWSGAGGCGAYTYSVQVQKDGGAFSSFSSGTAETKTHDPVTDGTADGVYGFRVTVTDALGNPSVPSSVFETTFDTRAPTAPVITNVTASQNKATISWTAATDGLSGIGGYEILRADTETGTFAKVGAVGASATTFVDTVALSADAVRFYQVRAVDKAENLGPVSATLSVELVPAGSATEDDIRAANVAVQTGMSVVRRDGNNIVAFDAASLTPTPAGIQIWRSTSPYTLYKTFEASSEEFKDGLFIDVDAPATAKYIITVFYGETVEKGKLTALSQGLGYEGKTDEQLDDVSKQATIVSDADGGGLAWWGWLLIVLLILLVVAAIVAFVLLRRRDAAPDAWNDDEWDEQEEAWDGDAGEGAGWHDEGGHVDAWDSDMVEVQLRCPQCSHIFTAAGERPIHTTCPNCSVKGVLN